MNYRAIIAISVCRNASEFTNADMYILDIYNGKDIIQKIRPILC